MALTERTHLICIIISGIPPQEPKWNILVYVYFY